MAPPTLPNRPGFTLGRGALGLERIYVGGFRNAVERHIDKRGYAACCRGLGRGLKAFPFRSARLVDVDMRVHEPRQQNRVAVMVQLVADCAFIQLFNAALTEMITKINIRYVGIL